MVEHGLLGALLVVAVLMEGVGPAICNNWRGHRNG